MKGVLLAGGEGSRLRELTDGRNKHLLPVGGEPMIAHGLRKLAGAGIKELLLVTGSRDLPDFEAFLEDAAPKGASVRLVPQDRPGGIAEALALCGSQLPDPVEPLAVLLGDNLFQAPLAPMLQEWQQNGSRARIHLSSVPDPERFGVAALDADGGLSGISEKPRVPASDLAVTGIYFLPAEAAAVARGATPSARGETEVVSVLRHYLGRGELDHALLEGWWVDAGTPESLEQASELLRELPPRFEA